VNGYIEKRPLPRLQATGEAADEVMLHRNLHLGAIIDGLGTCYLDGRRPPHSHGGCEAFRSGPGQPHFGRTSRFRRLNRHPVRAESVDSASHSKPSRSPSRSLVRGLLARFYVS
jgi:hypothetical protein